MDKNKEFDKELIEKFREIQEMLTERNMDFLLIASDRLAIKDLETSQGGTMGFSFIANKSEMPVLPMMLLSMATQNEEYLDFLRKLYTAIRNMSSSSKRQPSGKEKEYSN